MGEVVRVNWPERSDIGSGGNHTGGHEPPGGGSVEARVAKLESDVEYIKRDIQEISMSLKAMQGDISFLKTSATVLDERTGSISSHMVTKGQLAAYALGAVLGLLGAGWWLIQQYLSPILAALPKLP